MSLENFSKGQGDSGAGGGLGSAAPFSGMFCQLMQEGLKDIFKKAGGGGGGDPFNFSQIGDLVSKEISQTLGGKS